VNSSVSLRRGSRIVGHLLYLNQTICDWHIGRVTLSTAKGLVFLRDASPAAQHDRMRVLSSAYQRRVA